VSSQPAEPIRVVMVIKDADAYKGSAVQMRHLAAALVARGVEVQVLALWRHEPTLGGAFPDERITRLKASSSRDFYKAVEKWLVQNAASYDLIHVHGHGSLSLATSRAARQLKKPLLVKITSAGPETRLGSWQRWAKLFPFLRSRFVSHSDYWISISSEATRGLLDLGVAQERILVLSNGVDHMFHPLPERERAELRQQLQVERDQMVIVTIGNLTPHKHIDRIVTAFATSVLATGSSRRYQLWIIGNGKQRAALEERVTAAGLHNVTFTGSLKREEVARRLQAADIFVLASQNEGMSNALLESMSCGVAPLCAKISGNEDIVEDGCNGLLYPPDDEAGLTEMLTDLITQPEKVAKLGVQARSIGDKFGLESVAAQYEAAYRKVVAN
jgi:glycosyltransferase involved in cell wall biosynthesis